MVSRSGLMARPWSVASSPTLTTACEPAPVDDLLQPGQEPGRADPARQHRASRRCALHRQVATVEGVHPRRRERANRRTDFGPLPGRGRSARRSTALSVMAPVEATPAMAAGLRGFDQDGRLAADLRQRAGVGGHDRTPAAMASSAGKCRSPRRAIA